MFGSFPLRICLKALAKVAPQCTYLIIYTCLHLVASARILWKNRYILFFAADFFLQVAKKGSLKNYQFTVTNMLNKSQ